MNNTKKIYLVLIALAALSSIYSYFIPSLKPAVNPESIGRKLTLSSILGVTSINKSKVLTNNNSDRALSTLYSHVFDDSSKVLSIFVRVKKRDDFRIETYGLLTKDIPEINLEQPNFSNQVPYSILGRLNGRRALQTCIIPGTNGLQYVDVRSGELASIVDRRSPTSKSILSKILGKSTPRDYSCLVVTFLPSASLSDEKAMNLWSKILIAYQSLI